MPNRRRSERFEVALPIWLKDGQGGERTTTANVSSHGLAVVSPKHRPLRQYIELEIALPEPRAKITVTAVVARHAEFVEADSGAHSAGFGLDFFLFDARAKTSWQDFLRRLRTEGVKFVPPVELALEAATLDDDPRPLPERAKLEPAVDESTEEETPTFIIKPRDLGRLWAFYRGELAKGRVRIETPIGKPDGASVELLVVHPGSQAEWSLDGTVAETRKKERGGRPVLEITLAAVDAELKAAFRNFVATGRGMIEEDIDMVEDASSAPGKDLREEPPRLESVVIDLDALDESDVDLPSGIIDAPPRFVTPVEGQPSGLVDMDADVESRLPSRAFNLSAMAPPETPTPNPPSETRSVFASFFAEAAESSLADPADAPTPLEEDAPRTPPGPPIVTLGRLALEELRGGSEVAAAEAPDPKRLTGDLEVPPVAEEPPPVILPPHQATPAPERPMDLGEVARTPSSAHIADDMLASVHRAADAAVSPSVRTAQRSPRPAYGAPVVRSAPPPKDPPPLPPAVPKPPSVDRGLPDWIVPRSAALAPTGAPPTAPSGVHDRRSAPRTIEAPSRRAPVANTPVPPGAMYDFEEEEAEDHELPVKAAPDRSRLVGKNGRPTPPPLPPSARRAAIRSPVERENPAHRNLSTAGSDPDLDRDIALARAHIVRSPHSVTACYRLSMLLMRRGADVEVSEALESLKKVMTLEPNHPGAHHKIAELLARRGDYELASEHLSRARRLGYRIDPDLERIVIEGARSSS